MVRDDGIKIGVALSGASGRAITHIGVLEVLREHNIPVDIITACSSGTMVAASYACGTMDELKKDWVKLDKKFVLSLVELNSSGKGIFDTDRLMDWFYKYALNKKFEDVDVRLGFVCADIVTGEPVLLSLGDIAKAGRASCAVPVLFEPVQWGNKLLVDGGLFSIVPTSQAKQMGADIVIGVDIASTRYMYSTKYLKMRKGYNIFRQSFPVRFYLKIHDLVDRAFTKSVNFIYYNQSDVLEEGEMAHPGLLSILGKSMDISISQYDMKKGRLSDFDVMITPDVKHLGKMDFSSSKEMLEEGRKAALAALPKIKQLIAEKQLQKEKVR